METRDIPPFFTVFSVREDSKSFFNSLTGGGHEGLGQ